MNRKKYALSIIIVLSLIIYVSNNVFTKNNGLLIITTFPNIVRDIEQIICSSDKVLSITPIGVDPHDYSLKPNDVELVNRSNLLVSTRHTYFEIELGELISKRAIDTEIVEIPVIPGLVFRTNPSTGLLNYHMPIYDPLNYVLFIKYVSSRLESLNPICSAIYRNKTSIVIDKVLSIYLNTPRLNKTVIADYPYIQYAIEWIGFRIVNFVIKEHGLETTPDLELIEKAIVNREVDFVAITEPVVSKHSIWLLSKAIEYNISVIKVYSPLFNTTIVDKLIYIYRQVIDLYNQTTISIVKKSVLNNTTEYYSVVFLEAIAYVFGLTLLALDIYIVAKRVVV